MGSFDTFLNYAVPITVVIIFIFIFYYKMKGPIDLMLHTLGNFFGWGKDKVIDSGGSAYQTVYRYE